jgi:hypothetical protein
MAEPSGSLPSVGHLLVSSDYDDPGRARRAAHDVARVEALAGRRATLYGRVAGARSHHHEQPMDGILGGYDLEGSTMTDGWRNGSCAGLRESADHATRRYH